MSIQRKINESIINLIILGKYTNEGLNCGNLIVSEIVNINKQFLKQDFPNKFETIVKKTYDYLISLHIREKDDIDHFHSYSLPLDFEKDTNKIFYDSYVHMRLDELVKKYDLINKATNKGYMLFDCYVDSSVCIDYYWYKFEDKDEVVFKFEEILCFEYDDSEIVTDIPYYITYKK